jgi:hypothetical protein
MRGTNKEENMLHASRTGLRVMALVIGTLAAASTASSQSQQQPAPGTEATPAVGSQVQQMKPDCPPKTAQGDKQKEHPPTQAMDKQVPTMTAEGGCPDEKVAPGTTGQTK